MYCFNCYKNHTNIHTKTLDIIKILKNNYAPYTRQLVVEMVIFPLVYRNNFKL